MLYKQVSFLFINLLLLHVNCSSRRFLADGYFYFSQPCLKKSGQWTICMSTAGIKHQKFLHSQIQINFFLSTLNTKAASFRASSQQLHFLTIFALSCLSAALFLQIFSQHFSVTHMQPCQINAVLFEVTTGVPWIILWTLWFQSC